MDDLDPSRVTWRKSTHSNNGGACVEVARAMPDVIAIRDSKNPEGPKLAFTPRAWKTFTTAVQAPPTGH
jgi:Domain of unknown function (DUF397)